MTEKYVVYRENEPTIVFEGEFVAGTRSVEKGGTWKELTLYRTKAGTFVCNRITHTCWVGQSDANSSEICRGIPAVIRFFGNSEEAKVLYTIAKIETNEFVE